jgi:peptidoglycan/LPS O-acetylase OafA/YrhL
VGLTLTLLGAAAFLVAAYHTHARDFQRSLRWVSPLTSLVAGIGVYSYAIYLWHVTAMGILEREVGRRVLGFAHASPSLGWLVSALAITIGAIVVGMLAGRVVEWPVLRLRDRFFPSRSGGLSLPGTNVQSSVEPKERKAAVAV